MHFRLYKLLFMMKINYYLNPKILSFYHLIHLPVHLGDIFIFLLLQFHDKKISFILTEIFLNTS